MNILLTLLAVVACLALIIGPIVYMQIKKTFREQKNYERGLKLIPLLIHLPPQSDDAEAGGRDSRDIVDENISRAQILYNIIASTVLKGFKNKFYGQRHFSFEIIGYKGFVNYYVAVPVALEQIVRQAIVSAYPTARLEEVTEHNIFNKVGGINATMGGELALKETYAYPIATYQDLKRDAMQSILNALSSLDKEDGVGIQFLLRPADPIWRKNASSVASKKRKGKEKSGLENVGYWLSTAATALTKPPEQKSSDDKPELSSLEQATLDAIDEKTKHPGFEILIRVVASSNISQRAHALVNNVVASFSLFDSPGKNGFKYTAARDIERFIEAYNLRFFPQEHNKSILNTIELASLFHFPDQKNIPTSQLQRQASKQVDGPRDMPDDGLLLGYNVFRGAKKPIRLALEDRRRHLYAVGQTGTGKTTFLKSLAVQDMMKGDGFAFVDPHGDVAEELLSLVPRERVEDVIYFCPADMEYPMGLNLFEYDREDQKDFLIQETINMLYKLYDPQRQGIIGPRYEHIFRNCALALMADPGGATFIDIPKMLTDPQFMRQKLEHVTDQTVLDFWQKEFPASQRSNEAGEVTSWVVSKFGAFLSNTMMRNIIGQTKSSFNLRDIMDNRKILLVNLSKGRTGDLNSKLLGMIFVMKFNAAAMSRSDTPEKDRKDFCLYVDEFQNFSTDSFATIMSEARKFRLNLVVANQFTTQLSDEIRDAVFGNMGTVVSYRIGQNDVEALQRYFQPLFDGEDLLRVPNFNAIVRTLVGGVPTQPFSMAALPPLGTPNEQLGKALRQLSAAKYGRPKAKVEKEIYARLATKPPTSPPAFGSGSPGQRFEQQLQGMPGAKPSPAKSGSSFLDDWLAKRKTGPKQPFKTPSSLRSPSMNTPLPNHPASNPSGAGQMVAPDVFSQEPASTSTSLPTQKNTTLPQASPSPVSKTEGELNIRDSSNNDDFSTITIDRDGTMHAAAKGDQKP